MKTFRQVSRSARWKLRAISGWENKLEVFRGVLHMACAMIALRKI